MSEWEREQKREGAAKVNEKEWLISKKKRIKKPEIRKEKENSLEKEDGEIEMEKISKKMRQRKNTGKNHVKSMKKKKRLNQRKQKQMNITDNFTPPNSYSANILSNNAW